MCSYSAMKCRVCRCGVSAQAGCDDLPGRSQAVTSDSSARADAHAHRPPAALDDRGLVVALGPLLACSLIFGRAAGSARISRTQRASPCPCSSGGTSRPLSPSSIMSLPPGASMAMTGAPGRHRLGERQRLHLEHARGDEDVEGGIVCRDSVVVDVARRRRCVALEHACRRACLKGLSRGPVAHQQQAQPAASCGMRSRPHP